MDIGRPEIIAFIILMCFLARAIYVVQKDKKENIILLESKLESLETPVVNQITEPPYIIDNEKYEYEYEEIVVYADNKPHVVYSIPTLIKKDYSRCSYCEGKLYLKEQYVRCPNCGAPI